MDSRGWRWRQLIPYACVGVCVVAYAGLVEHRVLFSLTYVVPVGAFATYRASPWWASRFDTKSDSARQRQLKTEAQGPFESRNPPD